MHRFWLSWDTDAREQRYVAALTQLLPRLLASTGQHVHAVYVGGSFARRELVDDSDIDLYVIVTANEAIEPAIAAAAQHATAAGVQVQVHVYSLDELAQQRHLVANVTNRRMPPAVLLRELPRYHLVHGTAIDVSKHRLMSDDEYLRAFLPVLRRRLADNWGEREAERLKFIAKQIFFLVHHERKLRGHEHEFSRNELLLHFADETEHIIHYCDLVRKDPARYVMRKNEFTKAVADYLDFVERTYAGPASLNSR